LPKHLRFNYTAAKTLQIN